MATKARGQDWVGESTWELPPSELFLGTKTQIGQSTTDEELERLVEKTVRRQLEKTLEEKSAHPIFFVSGGTITFPVSGSVLSLFKTPLKEPLTITRELAELREKLKALEEIVSDLGSRIGTIAERVIVLRTITREEARNEIIKLFQEGGIHDYGEIAETLRLDLPMVVDICNELEREGLIGEPS